MNKKILFVVNELAFFASHRLPIARTAIADGYEVHLAAAPDDAAADTLRQHGIVVHTVRLERGSPNPIREAIALFDLARLMARLKPDLVHLITSKPIIYGGIAARLTRVPAVVAAVSGLGYVFTSPATKAKILRAAVIRLYRLAMGHANARIIFQNRDDLDLLVTLGVVKQANTSLIRGSGVPLVDYPFVPEPQGEPNVVFAARLLGDKGIVEFIEAVRMLRARNLPARYTVIGDPDPGNPTAIPQSTIREWESERIAEFLGYRKDIASLFATANLVVLPSYREGLPKVLVEAASCGRAVVTTDVPGCRDAIEPDRSGLLVPVRDSAALAAAIERLVNDAPLRRRMGLAGRALAEEAFDIRIIVAQHMAIYHGLLETPGSAVA
jgi:glycosyltransferase involved in cell wall biosynthesis